MMLLVVMAVLSSLHAAMCSVFGVVSVDVGSLYVCVFDYVAPGCGSSFVSLGDAAFDCACSVCSLGDDSVVVLVELFPLVIMVLQCL